MSLAGLGATAVAQAAVVAISGSVALLGDSVHNAADALTALPLGVAFIAGRRAATRRFTYGFGRAEDIAGIFIVVLIALSSALAAIAAVSRLLHPATVLPPARRGCRRGDRLPRQRVGRPVPDSGGPRDRLSGAGRRRPARAHRRLHLAGRAARRGRGRARLAAGRPGHRPGDHGGHPLRAQGRGAGGVPAADGRRGPGPAGDGRIGAARQWTGCSR